MSRRWFRAGCVWACVLGLAGVAACGWRDAAAGETDEVSPVAEASANPAAAADEEPTGAVPLAVAKDRAKLMHDIYSATLDVMHERYFHANRAVLPARALEDVFAEIRHQSQAEAKWLAVSLKAMNINNEPKSDFEKRAAKEIASGKSVWEEADGTHYRRVGAIPLGNGCVNCHAGFGREHTQTPKFAGLVISLPIVKEAAADQPE
jgi:hypothetical protein